MAAAACQILPAGLWLARPRAALAPALAGQGRAGHVALTFDDGPDPASTPAFLDLLDDLDVAATFFCVGEMALRAPRLVTEIADRGHEIGVHGWRHRNQLFRPARLHIELARTAALLDWRSGTRPRWYRPPYGVLTGQGLLAARSAGLRPVLWTRWGRDWEAGATPASVAREIAPGLLGGATLLLHDTDAYSAPGSWRVTLAAVPGIVGSCQDRGLTVGPLCDHGVGGGPIGR